VRALICLVCLSGIAGAHALPPVAPPMVGGVADARGQVVFVEAEGGRVDAVELATGKRLWSSRDGERPLHASFGLLLVAGPGKTLRFLKPDNGARLLEVGPVTPPAGATITVWVPMSRQPGDERWRVRWETYYAPAYGMRLPTPDEIKREKGLILVDAATGKSVAAPMEPEPVAPPALLPGFTPDRTRVYWSWSDNGAAWSSTPRAFRIGGGVMGYIMRENGGEKRVEVARWRPGEPLTPLTLARGIDPPFPLVTEDGRYVLLIEKDVTVHDLLRRDASPVKLPPFPQGFLAKIAVIGPNMYFVVNRSSHLPDGGTRIDRDLVALDWMLGRERWRYPLRALRQAPPVPGSGR